MGRDLGTWFTGAIGLCLGGFDNNLAFNLEDLGLRSDRYDRSAGVKRQWSLAHGIQYYRAAANVVTFPGLG